ncbi:hypothetical protein [Tateyamaria sp. SN3-11]|uniref:hypothetical protein n=1 Tax=Tateyamaria sp. SN3-11 TaxID=3092147 RepID=UPI0039EB4740
MQVVSEHLNELKNNVEDHAISEDAFTDTFRRETQHEEPWLSGPDDPEGPVFQFPVLHDPTEQRFTIRSYVLVDFKSLAGFVLALPAVFVSKGIVLVAGILGLIVNYSSAPRKSLSFAEGSYFLALWELHLENRKRPVFEDDILTTTNKYLRSHNRSEVNLTDLRVITNRLKTAGILSIEGGYVSPKMSIKTAYS